MSLRSLSACALYASLILNADLPDGIMLRQRPLCLLCTVREVATLSSTSADVDVVVAPDALQIVISDFYVATCGTLLASGTT